MLPGMGSRRIKGAAGGGGGGGGGLVTILTTYYESNVMDPSDASCGFTFQGTGGCNGLGGATYTWKLTAAPSSDYEIRIDQISGDATGGTTKGVWGAAGGASATLSRTTIGERNAVVRVQIRRASDTLVLEDREITLYAVVDA